MYVHMYNFSTTIFTIFCHRNSLDFLQLVTDSGSGLIGTIQSFAQSSFGDDQNIIWSALLHVALWISGGEYDIFCFCLLSGISKAIVWRSMRLALYRHRCDNTINTFQWNWRQVQITNIKFLTDLPIFKDNPIQFYPSQNWLFSSMHPIYPLP